MCWSRSLPDIVSFAFTPTPAMRRWAHCGSPCTRFGTRRSRVHWRGWHDTSTSTMCHVAQGAIRNDNECKFQCADPGNDQFRHIGTHASVYCSGMPRVPHSCVVLHGCRVLWWTYSMCMHDSITLPGPGSGWTNWWSKRIWWYWAPYGAGSPMVPSLPPD